MTIQAGFGGGDLPGGGWGDFFGGLLETGKGAAQSWWESRLDTEVALSVGEDKRRLGLAGLAAGHAGFEDIDNAAGHTGERGRGFELSPAMLALGAVVVLGGVYLATRQG